MNHKVCPIDYFNISLISYLHQPARKASMELKIWLVTNLYRSVLYAQSCYDELR